MPERLLFTLVGAIGVSAAVASGVVQWKLHGPYGDSSSVMRRIDAATGQTILAFSARGYGRPDTWSFLKDGKLVHMEFDENHDGIVDRWEDYGSNESLERAYQRDGLGGRILIPSAPAVASIR